MKLSSVALVLVLAVLSFGKLAEPSADQCKRLDLLSSYLDVGRYKGSHPYVDYQATLKSIVDVMDGRGVSNRDHDLIMNWITVCNAKTPEEEDDAWKNLARKVDHRLHIDESVLRIARIIYGDTAGVWLVNPSVPPEVLDGSHGDLDSLERLSESVYELEKIFDEHCGELGTYGLKYLRTFLAMFSAGVKKDELSNAAKQACADYNHPPL